jgi:hypothetical protein
MDYGIYGHKGLEYVKTALFIVWIIAIVYMALTFIR